MKKKILCLMAFVIFLSCSFFVGSPATQASYKKFTGMYTGTLRVYDMSCPKVYTTGKSKITLKLKVKKNGNLTSKLRFADTKPYTLTGFIKKGRIRLHYTYDTKSKYDYNGTIRGIKINMIAYNDDALGTRKCLTGWKQQIKAHKI